MADTYFSLVLNEHAVNMAVTDPVFHSNTIQLTATALDPEGNPLPVASQATFRATDSSVTVSPSGLVTAHFATSSGEAQVIATMQEDNITHADTAYIRVTTVAPAAAISTFSIQPVPGDSAVGSANTQYAPTVTATNTANAAMPFSLPTRGAGNFYWLATSNQTVAQYVRQNPDQFTLIDTGHVTLYATSWVYGVSVRDSLRFKVVWPMIIRIFASNDSSQLFIPSSGPYFLGVGGAVDWIDVVPAGDSLNILFEDSTAMDSVQDIFFHQYSGSGNLHFSPTGFQVRARRFPTVGTYHFYNALYPARPVTIFVLDNPQ